MLQHDHLPSAAAIGTHAKKRRYVPATNTLVFHAVVEHFLTSALRPGEIVVMDGLPVTKPIAS